MAEYLAPAVYVEEVDSGPKPIEGVSTSTAGMVGVAERGPLDVPILVTSIGDYERWFGGRLPFRDFVDLAGGAHCYLPYAVEGFFTNGGKRAYIVRVAPDAAEKASGFLYSGSLAGDAGTVLLRSATQGSGVTPPLYVLDASGIAVGDTVRIGEGSRAEYRKIAGLATGNSVTLRAPLESAHAIAPATVEIHSAGVAPVAGSATLNVAAASGTTTLILKNPGGNFATATPPLLLELQNGADSDMVILVSATVLNASLNTYTAVLAAPLPRSYPAGTAVANFASVTPPTDQLTVASLAGDWIVFVAGSAGVPGDIFEIGRGTPAHEARRIGALASFALDQDLALGTPANSVVTNILAPTDAPGGPRALSAAAATNSRVIALDNRVGLVPNQLLRIGIAPAEEYAVIAAIAGIRGVAPDAGTVTLAQPLTAAHASGAQVQVQNPTAPGPNGATRTLLAAGAGSNSIIVQADNALVTNDFISIERPDGATSVHRLGGSATLPNIDAVTLTNVLQLDHSFGEAVTEAHELIEVKALDVGEWGNRLRISVEEEANGLSTRTQTTNVTAPLEIEVASLTGIEAGTLLELTNPSPGGGTVLLKVRRIDRTNRKVTLDPPGLDAAAQAALGGPHPYNVRSREFALTVQLKRRPDPAVPSRDSMIIATESFGHLSMDWRHSNYFVKVIGDINGPKRLEDRRPEGESALIRVAEANPAADTSAIRPGPEALVDLLPSGGTAPARHALTGGDDSIATIGDGTYLGADNVEPADRTGLHALKSIQNVSIVAIPGQASAALQASLIAHCELMRYRFAVLDSAEPDDSLADVQQQRQAFDTKYAGLYYPWLTIPDPHPDTLTVIRDFPLPPSGHMIGIYARTDEERGVHKAPANEVVRGVTGLTKRLNKSEHDILNPGPVNINVIRDFRQDGRGIRAWGARCITSDNDYKYVPVRRLLIFLEQSMERGLQWVVFEPNSEALWARVRRTIRNFLTDVWRSGALEGVKPEEAFFVKCDRTTMTQTDIDNGRLICVVGVAPVKPAEFVIIRIQQFVANAAED